jgi:hypothetical protein
MYYQRNKKLLNRKEFQMMSPAPTNAGAGAFIIKDILGERRTAFYTTSATVHYLYDINEDAWLQIPSMAMAGAFAVGACGTWGLWSIPITATGGSTTTIQTTTPLSLNLKGKTIEFLTGSNSELRVTVADVIIVPGGTNTILLNETLPNNVSNGNTFKATTGVYYFLNAYTSLVSGVFKSYDVLSGTVTIHNQVGLPASWGTDAKMTTTPSYVGPFASGTATSATTNTLVNLSKSWTTNQWSNYQVLITGGTGAGQVRSISSNTSTTLTTTSGWTITPDATSTYEIQSNDDYIYLIGNNAVTLYRYSISSNTWITLTPTTPRAAAPGLGMGFNWIPKTGNTDWQNESNIQDGRWIYSFRGVNTNALHRYDIALNTWETVSYLRNGDLFTTGTSYDFEKGKIYIQKNITNDFFFLDVVGNELYPFAKDLYIQSTAVAGDKLFTVTYNDGGDDIDFIYFLGNSTNILRRTMIY